MSAMSKGVSVRILDKEYAIACPAGQEQILADCAHQLDTQMRVVQQSGKITGLDRIAIMAGLNLARKFLNLQQLESNEDPEITHRLKQIHEKIDETLLQNNFTLFGEKPSPAAFEPKAKTCCPEKNAFETAEDQADDEF